MDKQDIRRVCKELKLTEEMENVFKLASLDPEKDREEIKKIFEIPLESIRCLFGDDDELEDGKKPRVMSLNRRVGGNIKLDLQNEYGNTILHGIALAYKENHQDFGIFIQLFDVVISSSYMWWCYHEDLDLPYNNKIRQLYKRSAVRYLTTEIHNNLELNVFELAFKTGATPVVERLLMMDEVTCSSTSPYDATNQTYKYDITYITPRTNGSVSKCMDTECIPEPSCLERLLSSSSDNAEGILDLPPLKSIENMYNSVTTKIYVIVTLLHILYMALFSYVSCDIVEKRRNSTADTMEGTRLLFFIVGPIEPIIFALYLLYNLYKFCTCKATCWVNCDRGNAIKEGLLYLLTALLSSLYVTTFLCLVTVFIVQCSGTATGSLHYVMSITLLYGWLMTFTFAKGIKDVHFFLRVTLHLLIHDVLKILLVYIFFLLAFSLALHSQFLVSFQITNTYKTPIHTMFLLFNVMMGMGEMFDEEMDSNLEQGGAAPVFSKLIYISYIVLVTVMLLNLLIAIMNKSYSRIRKEHPLSWRVKAIQLGINIERTMPWISRFLGTGQIRRGPIFDNLKDDEVQDDRWYVDIEGEDSKEDEDKFPVKERTLKDIEDNIIDRLVQGLEDNQSMIEDMKDEYESANMNPQIESW